MSAHGQPGDAIRGRMIINLTGKSDVDNTIPAHYNEFTLEVNWLMENLLGYKIQKQDN